MNAIPLRWTLALALSAMVTGCGDRHAPAAVTGPRAEAPASVVATTAAVVAAATPPSATAAGPAAAPAIAIPPAANRASADPGKIKVKRLVVARGVEDRQPVDVATTFSTDEAARIYAYVEVENGDREDGEIFVAFEPEDGPARGQVKLEVGPSPRWRTWAFTRGAREPGAWTAVVRNASGEVLARAPFQITS